MPYEEDDEEKDYPDAADLEEDGDGEVLDPCPHCHRLMYDETERCPHCGEYISPPTSAQSNSWGFIIAVVICIAVVIFFFIR